LDRIISNINEWSLNHRCYHGLSGTQAQPGCSVDFLMSAIEETIDNFFMQALQLDTFTLRLEAVDEGE